MIFPRGEEMVIHSPSVMPYSCASSGCTGANGSGQSLHCEVMFVHAEWKNNDNGDRVIDEGCKRPMQYRKDLELIA